MGYMIVSDNKPSSLALHKNNAIVLIKILKQMPNLYVLNFIKPKIKWDGAEETTINNFYKVDNRKF